MTIRWGFLGAGYVASRALAPAVHAATGARLQGVASRDVDRSWALEPVEVFDSYATLIESPNFDAVYISLTNSQHREWVIAALEAGKHVLCEKPLGMDAGEVREMGRAARSTGRSLVEAVWVRWHPRHRRFAEIVRSGNLGSDVHVTSAFTFDSDMAGNYRLDPERGGGALMDVGCYQVFSWFSAFGSDIDVRIDHVDRVQGPTGVDLTTRARVTLDGAGTGDMVCSFIETPRQRLEAEGSDARVEMFEGEAFTSWREPSSLRVADTIETFPECDAFVLMVEQVSRHFSGLEGPLFDFEESVKVADVIDDIRSRVQT